MAQQRVGSSSTPAPAPSPTPSPSLQATFSERVTTPHSGRDIVHTYRPNYSSMVTERSDASQDEQGVSRGIIDDYWETDNYGSDSSEDTLDFPRVLVNVAVTSQPKPPDTLTTRVSGVAFPPAMEPPSAEKGTVSYNIRHNHRTLNCWGALVDRVANGGIRGRDMKETSRYQHRTVDLTGLKEHTVRSLGVGTAGAWTRTQAGPVIIIIIITQ